MKYEIEIPDEYKIREGVYHVSVCDSCGSAVTFKTTIKKVEPPYSRQTVLRELWEPTSGESFYSINKYSPHSPHTIAFHEMNGDDRLHPIMSNCIFAPTLKLAQEIVRIREGNWLPKEGDAFVGCDKNFEDSAYIANSPARMDFLKSIHFYFPSKEQRQTFIDKNKPKETPKEKIRLVAVENLDQCSEKHYPIGAMRGYVPKEIYEENGFLKVR